MANFGSDVVDVALCSGYVRTSPLLPSKCSVNLKPAWLSLWPALFLTCLNNNEPYSPQTVDYYLRGGPLSRGKGEGGRDLSQTDAFDNS